MELFEARPNLLTHQHGPGPFIGEHSMHIMVVNRNEDLLCRCLQLATRIPRDERAILLNAQTTGGFFMMPPQKYYGSSLLGYACSFGLKRAVWMMVTDPQLGLDLNSCPCGMSGFYPVHAAVVNGQKEMFDFLTNPNGNNSTSVIDDGEGIMATGWALQADGSDAENLPLGLLAKEYQVTAITAHRNLSRMTALQLVTLFGNQDMFTHIVQKQSQVRWMWGPLACFAIDAREVDRAAKVVARLDSTADTQVGCSTRVQKRMRVCTCASAHAHDSRKLVTCWPHAGP